MVPPQAFDPPSDAPSVRCASIGGFGAVDAAQEELRQRDQSSSSLTATAPRAAEARQARLMAGRARLEDADSLASDPMRWIGAVSAEVAGRALP